MVHFIFSDRGFLVPVVTFASCLVMELTTRAMFQDDTYYQEHCCPIPLALTIAGVVCVVIGQVFSGGEPERWSMSRRESRLSCIRRKVRFSSCPCDIGGRSCSSARLLWRSTRSFTGKYEARAKKQWRAVYSPSKTPSD